VTKVLIFGLHYHGRAVYRSLNKSLYKIVGFIDNDVKKSGELFGDIKIHHTSDLSLINFDKIIIAGRNIDEMVSQLINDFHLSKEKIIIMNRSDIAIKGKDLEHRESVLCNMLFHFTNLVNEREIDYWVTKSSLLALKRGEKFAKFSDVDIVIMSSKVPLFLNILEELQCSYNIEINRQIIDSKYWKKGDVSSVKISEKADYVAVEPALIDITILNKFSNNIYIRTLHNTITVLPTHFFDGNDTIKRYNINFSVPKNSEEYLRFVYGKEWRIPTEQWQHKNYKSIKRK
jgi:hypothetical protein